MSYSSNCAMLLVVCRSLLKTSATSRPMCTRCERTTKYQAWRCFSLDLVIRAHTFICPTGSRPIAWSTRERMIMTRRSEERRVGKEWRPGGAGEDWNDRQIKQERDELV